MAKISIIIPVYNVESYLRECLDSVINQTFHDLEIICIDDGSTDGSGAILDEYAARDTRFVVVHRENRGISCSRNEGLEHATGESVLFLDSDDALERNACELLMRVKTNHDADMIQFGYRIFGGNETIVPALTECGEFVSETEKIRMTRVVPSIWLYLYRADFLQKRTLKFAEEIIFEDISYVYHARLLANRILTLPVSLYRYRVGSGYSTSASKERSYLCYPAAFNRMIQELQTENASPETLRLAVLRKMNEVYFAWQTRRSIRREFTRVIRNEFLPEERALLAEIPKISTELRAEVRLFYRATCGGLGTWWWNSFRFTCLKKWDWFVERLYYRSSLYPQHEEERRWLRHLAETYRTQLCQWFEYEKQEKDA